MVDRNRARGAACPSRGVVWSELIAVDHKRVALDLDQVAAAVAYFEHDALPERRRVHAIAWTEGHTVILRQVKRRTAGRIPQIY
jgi:hypothetical protein